MSAEADLAGAAGDAIPSTAGSTGLFPVTEAANENYFNGVVGAQVAVNAGHQAVASGEGFASALQSQPAANPLSDPAPLVSPSAKLDSPPLTTSAENMPAENSPREATASTETAPSAAAHGLAKPDVLGTDETADEERDSPIDAGSVSRPADGSPSLTADQVLVSPAAQVLVSTTAPSILEQEPANTAHPVSQVNVADEKKKVSSTAGITASEPAVSSTEPAPNAGSLSPDPAAIRVEAGPDAANAVTPPRPATANSAVPSPRGVPAAATAAAGAHPVASNPRSTGSTAAADSDAQVTHKEQGVQAPLNPQTAAMTSPAPAQPAVLATAVPASTEVMKTDAPAWTSESKPSSASSPSLPSNSTQSVADTGAAAAPVGPVQMAQMVNRVAQSEMKVGLTTSEFGSVEIRTVVHASNVGLTIGSEKGDLHSLLANEIPAIADTLQRHNLELNQVSFRQSFTFSGDLGSRSDSQAREFARPYQLVPPDALPAGPEVSTDAANSENPAAGYAGFSILA